MSFSEQADIPSERIRPSNILDQLTSEQQTVGSVPAYISRLERQYYETPLHRPNMLQLQRMAKLVTNPNAYDTIPSERTDAFYWGEIVAYRSQELLSSEDWSADAYKILSQKVLSVMNEFHHTSHTAEQSMNRTAHVLTRDLELPDLLISDQMDHFIEEWAKLTIEDVLSQRSMQLGFRYIITEMNLMEADLSVSMAMPDIIVPKDTKRERTPEEVSKDEAFKITKKFLKILKKKNLFDIDVEVDATGIPQIESIDDVGERLREKSKKYIDNYGEFDHDDPAALADAQSYVEKRLRKFFNKMEGIEKNELVEASGKITMMWSKADNVRLSYALNDNAFVKGFVNGISVGTAPEFDFRGRRIKGGVNLFGVSLVLNDPIVVAEDGTHISLDDKTYIYNVLLTSPELRLEKYLA